MKYLDEPGYRDADSGDERAEPTALLEAQADDLRDRILGLKAGQDLERAGLEVELARVLLRLERMLEVWRAAEDAFERFAEGSSWEGAIQALDLMYRSEQPGALAALGQAIWLAVTFPVDPELTVSVLEHVVDETPANSDGAAVAAAVAHWIVALRAEGRVRENLHFYTSQLLASVARRHSGVEQQEGFEAWVQRLELNTPEAFLPRLRNIVDVLVQDEWRFDRASLQAGIPVN